MGASLRRGLSNVLALNTCLKTTNGAIAARLRARQPEGDFACDVRRPGYQLIRVMVFIGT
jgi:Mg2+-importing ATPase